MILIRASFLLAIYGISCCYSLHMYQLASSLQDTSRIINRPSLPEKDESVKTQSFEQKLNHFDKKDTRKWNQEYHENNKYYRKGGPVYLWIEGNKLSVQIRVTQGYWVSHAEKHKAMLFSIGHRFHKISFAMDDTSDANLKYLNISQALSDYAAFVEGMKKLHDFPKNTKWILFGSSYGGNLAAWMRAKYPNLIHGAVASSAPVLAQMHFPGSPHQQYMAAVAGAHKCFKEENDEGKKMFH